MADPIALEELPDGVKHAPSSIDAVPSDWPTVRYVPVIEAHPDDPTSPIMRWRTVGELVSTAVITEGGEFIYEDGEVLTE